MRLDNATSLTFYVHRATRASINPYGVFYAHRGRWWVRWEGYS
jgi:hypothetical protein